MKTLRPPQVAMKTHSLNLPKLARFLGLVLLSVLNPQLSTFAQGTSFTYQGRLADNGAAATGNYDLRFTIYDAASGGNQAGNSLTNSPVAVSAGIFTALLDFGPGVFPGANRWLQIGVRTNGSVGAFTPL